MKIVIDLLHQLHRIERWSPKPYEDLACEFERIGFLETAKHLRTVAKLAAQDESPKG